MVKRFQEYLDEKISLLLVLLGSITLVSFGCANQIVECVESEFDNIEQKYVILHFNFLKRFPEFSSRSGKEIHYYNYIDMMRPLINKDLMLMTTLDQVERYSIFLGRNISNANMVHLNLKFNCDYSYEEREELRSRFLKNYFEFQKKNYLGANSWYGYSYYKNNPRKQITHSLGVHGYYHYDGLILK